MRTVSRQLLRRLLSSLRGTATATASNLHDDYLLRLRADLTAA
jgi:hypothetical protein